MPWDPLGAWPAGRHWLWAGLAALACCLQGPAFIGSLRPPRQVGVDFFQEWASARNLFTPLPIYTNHKVTIPLYLGYDASDLGRIKVDIDVNAHPPTSVLLAVPLAGLDYPDAVFVWNLLSLGALGVSLWLVGRELKISWPLWSLFPAVALLLLCNPLRQQVNHGQLNLVLLLLLTGTWVAYRSGRPVWAGYLLAAATAVKLFPGFFFLFFALQRQWKIVIVGIISLAILTGLTAAILGVETYQSYIQDVLPQLQRFRSDWINASLVGFWSKLFDLAPEQVRIQEWWPSPTLAHAGAFLCCAMVVAVWAMVVWRARTLEARDQAFGLTVTAMLLVSPMTWDHYFLLLLIPLVVLWTRLPAAGWVRAAFLVIILLLWAEPMLFYNAFIPGGFRRGVATPLCTFGVLSLQCYALLGLFALSIFSSEATPPVLPGKATLD
jgi:hypothetical protein